MRPKFDPLAEKMLKRRLELGLSQEEMAREFSTTRSTYNSWERYGPPNRPILRKAVMIVLEKLRSRTAQRRDADERNARRRARWAERKKADRPAGG